MARGSSPPLPLDPDEWPAFDPRWRGVRGGFRLLAAAAVALFAIDALRALSVARPSIAATLTPASAGLLLAPALAAAVLCFASARTFLVPSGTAARPLAAVAFLSFLCLSVVLAARTPLGPRLGDVGHALDAAGLAAIPATKACAFASALAAGALVIVAIGSSPPKLVFSLSGALIAVDLFVALSTAQTPAHANVALAVSAADALVLAWAMTNVGAALWAARDEERVSEAPGEPLFFPEEWSAASRGFGGYMTALSGALLVQVMALVSPIAVGVAHSESLVRIVAAGMPAVDAVMVTWMAVALSSARSVPDDTGARQGVTAAVTLLAIAALADAAASCLVLLPDPPATARTLATVGDGVALLAAVSLLAAFRRLARYLGQRDVLRRVTSVQGFLVLAVVVTVAARAAIASGLASPASVTILGLTAWAFRLVALARHLGVTRQIQASTTMVAEGRLSGAPNAVSRGAPRLG